MREKISRPETLGAREVAKQFRRDPENNRLYLEAEIRQDLAERMAGLRRAAGLTQKQLAERVGRKQSFLARLEAGAYDRCGLSTLRTFARAMGYDIDTRVMFVRAEAERFTGHSSCGDLENALGLRDEVGDDIAHISLSKWERADLNAASKIVVATLSEGISAAA